MAGDTVFVPGDGGMTAFDRESGSELWDVSLPGGDREPRLRSAPAVADGYVVFGASDSTLRALTDGADGDFDDDSGLSAPTVSFAYDYKHERTAGPGEAELTLTVSSGDAFSAGTVTFEGERLGGADGTTCDEQSTDPDVGPDTTVTAGDRATLTGLTDAFELDVVWTDDESGERSIIASRTGPDP